MNRFEDHRGVIQDWDVHGVPVDAVTHITTLNGAVRGNHVHHATTQWTLVIKGRLLMATGDGMKIMEPLDMVQHDPGVPHAWKALEDSECVVFAVGPRAGENYESDTERLKEPLL